MNSALGLLLALAAVFAPLAFAGFLVGWLARRDRAVDDASAPKPGTERPHHSRRSQPARDAAKPRP
jgi:hypothetical protein